MLTLWNVILYKPLFNALIFLISIVPGHNVGLAVILLTVIVKLILFPLTKRSIVSQAKLKQIEPELNAIKINYPDKQTQAQKTLELYRANKVNPFAGCLLILIQIPIIFALYFVFFKGLTFNENNLNLLYSFVNFPAVMSQNFLGVAMQTPSLIFAILAGVSQFLQVHLSPAFKKNKDAPVASGFAGQMQKSMNVQMKYILPIFIAFVAYKISAAVALYWITSNVFTIVQEMLVRRSMNKREISPEVVVVK
jgi:YidC/Oxa1 family membrane protein insertase